MHKGCVMSFALCHVMCTGMDLAIDTFKLPIFLTVPSVFPSAVFLAEPVGVTVIPQSINSINTMMPLNGLVRYFERVYIMVHMGCATHEFDLQCKSHDTNAGTQMLDYLSTSCPLTGCIGGACCMACSSNCCFGQPLGYQPCISHCPFVIRYK